MKEIKTTTIYNDKLVKKFLRDYYFDRVKKARLFINILIVIIIIYFFTKNKVTTIDIIAFVISVLGIIEINSSFLPSFNFWKLKKRKDSILNTKVKYIFKERNFKISATNDEYIDYKDLKKIIEVDNAFYLYINNSKAFILDKENLKDNEQKILAKRFQDNVSTYQHKK